MEIKLLEIRDRATFIPAMAVKLSHSDVSDPKAEVERWLLRRSGYSEQQIDPLVQEPLGLDPYIVLIKLVEIEAHYDPFDWPNYRTMGNAHRYLIDRWNDIASGDVIDVEYVLKESAAPKKSERVSTEE